MSDEGFSGPPARLRFEGRSYMLDADGRQAFRGVDVVRAPDEPLPPLLLVLIRALEERGWKREPTVGSSPLAPLWVDPEGNKYASIEQAVTAQTFREIASS